jgi:cytochrome c-type biogenesis protein CcmH
LFVFARAVNGPKMPLAVLRVPVPQSWPFTFSLDDSMAMAPGMKLSAFPEVTIEARISKAGNAMPQPGDLAGQSAAVKPGTANVGVSIARVLP